MQMSGKEIDHVQAIIRSMTMQERENPSVINASRKKRIARGSGRSLQEVNRLLKQFNEMKKMMKQMTSQKGKKKNPFGNMGLPF
jgi:signal recognition particle subunit SRP54